MDNNESKTNIWNDKIRDLYRSDLDSGYDPSENIISKSLPNLVFVQIEGLLRSWDKDQDKQQRNQQGQQNNDPTQGPKRQYAMEDVLASLYGLRANFGYLIIGDKTYIKFYLGTAINGLDETNYVEETYNHLTYILQSVYTGIPINKQGFTQADIRKIIEPYAKHVGILTGVPSIRQSSVDTRDSEQLERIASGMQGEKFGIMTLAIPVPENLVSEEMFSVSRQIQKAQENEDAEKKRLIKHYLELVEAYYKQLDTGTGVGLFQTITYYFSNELGSFTKLDNVLRGVFSGENNLPTPVRNLRIPNLPKHLLDFGIISNTRTDTCYNKITGYKYLTPLNARQLSALIHIPRRELTGFRIYRYAEFTASEVKPKNPDRSIAIGNILEKGVDTGNLYCIDVDALQKHTIVCGVTGGGKTNTCFYLLGQLWSYKVPFMVIEPAKSEYRHMMLMSQTFKGIGQAFSLGDETVSPFRLNPFEIMKGVKVQTHLDALKSVFNASFEMYAPMPQVLEKALNAIYAVRGWDLVQNINRRLPPNIAPGDPNCPPEIYPTMKDLYEIIDPIVESFGYSQRIGPDVQAALKARIGSLLIGGKGQMLNTRRSIPPEILFGRPTVVELKMVSEDSEKSFLMGMLLVFLYEYRESLGPHDHLQHVMLVEEAHRLLKNVPTGQSSDSANPAGKAVEFFTNMLAEIRSYGQGFIIADQIPNKLAPEALKNTNLKVMHRIVAQDDRDSMGGAMNIEENQKRHVTALGQGQAAVYAEKMEIPYNLAIMFDKTKEVPPPKTPEESDQIVRDAMAGLNIVSQFDRHLGCKLCVYRCDTKILDKAIPIADDQSFRQLYNQFILDIMHNPKQILNYRDLFFKEILRISGSVIDETNLTGVTWCALTQATERYYDRRGELASWQYDIQRKFHNFFLEILRLMFPHDNLNPTVDEKTLEQWRQILQKFNQERQGPYAGCVNCQNHCAYQFEVSELVRNPKIQADFEQMMGKQEGAIVEPISKYSSALAKGLIENINDNDLSYCIALHLIKALGLRENSELEKLTQIRAQIEDSNESDPAKPGASAFPSIFDIK